MERFSLRHLISTLPDQTPTLSSLASTSSMNSPSTSLSIFSRYFSNISVVQHNRSVSMSIPTWGTKRHYSFAKEQRVLAGHEAHIQPILRIQRWWRKCRVDTNRKMETIVLAKVNKRIRLEKENQRKREQLTQLQRRKEQLLHQSENQYLRDIDNQIAAKIRKALSGTLQCADGLAQGNAKARFVLSQIKEQQNQCEVLEGEIQALKFEHECHRKRKQQWQNKLAEIRDQVLTETLRAKDLRNKISQLQSRKFTQTMTSISSNL